MPDGNTPIAGAKPVRVGLLGCGAIGSAFLKLLCRPRLQDRFSVPYVVVRDPAPGTDPQRQHRLTQRDEVVALARETWSTRIVNAVDFEADVDARYDEVDVVVEAVGPWEGPAPASGRTSPSPGSRCGYERTCSLLKAALGKRKPVVTANKSVIARWGNELAALAAGSAGQEPVSLKFEAAVCGSIPIVRTLASHWRDQGIRKIAGILNGTCNFVLSSMSAFDEARHGADGYASKRNRALAWAFDQALAKGLAERPACGQDVSADLTNADLSGRDAAEKLVILAAIAFGVRVDCAHVSMTPINDVAVSDIRFAAEMGYAIKQLAVAELDDKYLSLSVHPTLVPTHHPLANVSDQDNAVCVRGEFGNQMYTGEGAGAATATALLSDLLDIETGTARNHEFSRNGDLAGIRVRPAEQHRAMGYLRTECQDVTGAFYKKAQVLYDKGISVEQMLNLPMHTRRENGIELVPDIILIAPTDQARIDRAVDDLQSATIGADRVAICRSRPVFLRIRPVNRNRQPGDPSQHHLAAGNREGIARDAPRVHPFRWSTALAVGNRRSREPEIPMNDARLTKLAALRAAGVEPYPYRFDRTHTTAQIRDTWDNLEGDARSGETVRPAGRITNWRNMGKTIFADIQDQSGRLQLFLNKGVLGDDRFALLELWDLGDWVGVNGRVFRTRTGELSIRVEDAQMLCKATRGLPDKHAGLQNPELIYRDRSAYFTSSRDAREVFVTRSRAIRALRDFMTDRGYMEVETPVLQPVYGGAAARPFTTHVWAIDEDYFLQISPELYLKRLVAGGFEAVFTVCKNFRNEGIDKTHNPEFTMMESYGAYADYRDVMELTEQLYAHVLRTVLGRTTIVFGHGDDGVEPVELRFEPPWPRHKMLDLVRRYAGIDVGALDEAGLRRALLDLPDDDPFFGAALPRREVDAWTWGELVQALFEFHVEPKLIQPCFVIDHPKETTPLCKIHRDDLRLIERFEPFANGWELGNAYSELNDPIRQRELLAEQAAQRRAGNEEATPFDEDFCAAIDLGIPPTGGLGIGIDRLVMLLTNRSNIKDVILFPFTRSGHFKEGAFPISRSRAHTHRRHGHPLQTVPSAGLIERPQEKNRVDALR